MTGPAPFIPSLWICPDRQDPERFQLYNTCDLQSQFDILNLTQVFRLQRRLLTFLTSVKSFRPSDRKIPCDTSNFSFRINPKGCTQVFLYEGHAPKWRSGHWNGVRWSGIPQLQRVTFIFNYSYVDNENEISFSWNNAYVSILTRAVLNESGIFQRSKWHENEGRWEEFASAPKD
ncbi:G-type lectin S-receptor-like serine/threonine-protein kinase At1g11410 [Hevea brasiliensis]|uniref:G-type lectin S-receptor-like serine/threonine-protein kinase At1g11410 n=1 Tax=Hevea brasiliensis TaxID=3981 RepID=UPI0025FD28BC|nr:G-type lectin S-receptor-like serine/threonine-protein kinase At1g11410 [Hevea brasiliensis]